MTNEFLLMDRLQKIRQVIQKYGEENFYLSFSGGKDSTVLSALIDMALPGNKIPRVYANTGIELNMIRGFVLELAKSDNRIEIIKPSIPIKKMLEREGYPFKSKEHSQRWREFENGGINLKHIQRYLELYKRPNDTDELVKRFSCPKKIRFQFTNEYIENGLKISDKCCEKLKEEPLHKYQEEHDKPYGIVGIMRDEGGRRNLAKCLAFKDKGKMNFQPLAPVTKEWEDWFIAQYNIEICDIYKPPYNFGRTGCKGCPFNVHLQRELDTLQQFFPKERKQCEIIWKPVYDEYRRIGYRLRQSDSEGYQRNMFDL
jgi:3'-phosphoadenosine 5'-phosphosulfate sulfotransferase (PAPS reductase)/FAD synthetase